VSTTEQPRIALVTGANKGIGYAICDQLSAQGIEVVLTARSRDRGMRALDTLGPRPLRLIYHPLDVTDQASIDRVREYVTARFGRLDILINNAGVALDKFRPALELDLDTLRATMETNVYGAFAVTRALAPLLRASRHGRIVNLSSVLGSLTNMGGLTLAYRMSKTALNALTRVLAEELRADGVLVNAMCPGWVRTELGGFDAERTPEQGAATAIWLATLAADGPTGGFFKDRQPVPW
jgi:NAD(P)-dependent dehydrogenase (short-subunit alcohol dehydrogenase family)